MLGILADGHVDLVFEDHRRCDHFARTGLFAIFPRLAVSGGAIVSWIAVDAPEFLHLAVCPGIRIEAVEEAVAAAVNERRLAADVAERGRRPVPGEGSAADAAVLDTEQLSGLLVD